MATIKFNTPTGDRITTNSSIAADLRATLLVAGVYAGETWGEFKSAVEALGIRDEHEIRAIDYGNSQRGTGRLLTELDQDGMTIRELHCGGLAS